MFKGLLLITLLIGLHQTAQAHDPGVSSAKVQLGAGGLVLHLDLDRQAMITLTRTDVTGDGTVDVPERSRLQTILAAGVEVRDAHGRLTPQWIRIDAEQGDGASAEISFEYRAASPILLQIPLVARLGRDHRLYLSVLDADGRAQSRHWIGVNAPPLQLMQE